MNRIMKALSIFTIVMLALALMPAGSVLAALNPLGPITSTVTVVPNPAPLNGSATIKAAVDNTAIGSNIVSAEYSLNGGGWLAMAATDGAFDSLTEAVNATFTAAQMEANTVCVHADDLLGNTGPDACYDFTVTDQTPPIVSNVAVAPVPLLLNGPGSVNATVDDSTAGGSNIASAAYQLNGGAWTAMKAVDGAFDAVSEAVTATISTARAGANQVCVRGTDAANNTSAGTCLNFAVQYIFKGFQAPIKMGVTNKANAPQTIPVKWWLTDANGKPVSSTSSFKAIMSYKVDCTTLIGDPAIAVAGTSPGKSGLKYQGNGRWMINWKTDKSFRSTCRKMFIAFNSVQNSPEVVFAFK